VNLTKKTKEVSSVKKKLTAISIAACMMTSSLSGLAADISEFSDIPSGWAHDAVVYAVENGILKGDNNQVFPDRLLTRAETAALINRSLGLSEKADISEYTDVPTGAWYYDDMAIAAAAGIFQGSDNELRPEAQITREEVFAVIARAYKLESDNNNLSSFNDENSVSDWAKSSAAALIANGYVNGDDKNNLRPKDNITRAELAQILYNINGKSANNSSNPSETSEPTESANTDATENSEATSTSTPTATTKPSHSGGGSSSSSKTSYSLNSADTVEVDGVTYYYASLPKPMSRYKFTFDGKTVTPTAVNDEKTVVKYTADSVDLSEKKYAKTALTYGEYWYTETSDGYLGTLTTSFVKDGEVAEIPASYTASQSNDDEYGATGADTDAGMYDAVSRATTGYGLGRLSFTQTVIAKTASGDEKQFKSDVTEDNGTYTIVRPENAKDEFGYDSAQNRGSNGEFKAVGFEDVVVAVSKDMAVNAEILKNIDGYEEQAKAVSDIISNLSFDDSLTYDNVYDYKELNANGLYGKRVVNENVSVKDIGNYSEANTTADNAFTVNTKYGRRYGDVTFLFYFDDYKDMKKDSASSNINTDAATEGKVGEFKNYIYNVTRAKIEYLGEDGTSEPIVVGTKFGSDIWISPNHGPVVELAVTKSYDRFKSLGDGKYRITLMADGYKDVVLETSASFDVHNPLEMQTDDDDVDEIKVGSDLVLKYNIVNQKYVDALKALGENNKVTLTSGSGRDAVTVASGAKLSDENGVLTVTFENVKDKLTKDTQYTVNFPTIDYNDADKLGMTASVHYAPADGNAQDTYVLMNIPYDEFYGAEIDSDDKADVDYDAVSSATNKVGNYGKSGGAYHSGTTAQIDDDGNITAVGGANGASNKGVIWPVKVSDVSALTALGGTAVTDASTVTVATQGRGQTTSTALTGYQTLTEATDYSYYVLSGEPDYYLELSIENGKSVFTLGEETATVKTDAEPTVTYGSHWGDVQLSFTAATEIEDKQINAVVITAEKNGETVTAGLAHLYNVWSYSEMAWKNENIEGLDGATITHITYYCNNAPTDGSEPEYYVYDYQMNVSLLSTFEDKDNVTATFGEDNSITLTGLPSDIENLKAQVYHSEGRPAVTTYLTPLAVDPDDDDIDPTTVDVENGVIPIESGSVTNKAGTTQTYGTPVDGTTYTISLSSDNYAPFTVTAEYTAE
jgi:hypothetical protein